MEDAHAPQIAPLIGDIATRVHVRTRQPPNVLPSRRRGSRVRGFFVKVWFDVRRSILPSAPAGTACACACASASASASTCPADVALVALI